MTYPPPHGQQPPYPQQPGNYGGQGGGFPAPGGPQQPAGYPQSPYPSGGQYGAPPPGGGFGAPPPPGGGFRAPPPGGGFGAPPPKKRTGLWIGLSAGAVVIVAFLVTAFAAPGFLLSDDNGEPASASGAAAGGGSGTDADASGSGATALANKIAQGFLAHDKSALEQLACADAASAVNGFTREAEMVQEFTLNGDLQESGDTATVSASVLLAEDGKQMKTGLEMELTKAKSGNWCWQDAKEPN